MPKAEANSWLSPINQASINLVLSQVTILVLNLYFAWGLRIYSQFREIENSGIEI